MNAIDQCLYGYKNGHQLLASSVVLKPEFRNRLLVLSDLSGTQAASGFDTYLTASPLSQETFCLIRTWRAPEIPRTGAVWSHVLLLRSDMFDRRVHLESLIGFFRRPTVGTEFVGYDTQIDPGAQVSFDLKEPQAEDIGVVLEGMRSSRGRSVVLVAGDRLALEAAVLRVWDCLWPNAQKSLRFCTGALAIRSEDFDYEIVPPRLLQKLEGNRSTNVVIADAAAPLAQDTRALAAALVAKDAQGLLDWVRASGDRLEHWHLPFVTAVGRALTAGASRLDVVQSVAAEFPSTDLAKGLKRAVLGEAESSISTLELLRSPVGNAYDAETVGLRMRVHRDLADANADISSYIDAVLATDTPLAADCLKIVVDEIGGLVGSRRPFALNRRTAQLLLRERPSIATAVSFWTNSELSLRDVWSEVRAQPDSDLSGLIRAYMEGRGPEGLRSIQDCGEEAFRIALGIVAEMTGDVSSWLLVAAASCRYQTDVLWRVVRSSTTPQVLRLALLIVSAVADANDRAVRGVEDWSGCEGESPFPPGQWRDRSEAFLFVLALRGGNSSNGRMFAANFGVLYEKLRTSRLDSAAWTMLSNELPGGWFDWDRCSRLLNAFAKHVSALGMSALELSSACKSDDQFARLVETLAERYPTYFRRLQSQAERSGLTQVRLEMLTRARAS